MQLPKDTSDATVQLPETPVKADVSAKDVFGTLIKEQSTLIQKYRASISHTGNYLTNSMAYAYARGVSDAIKLVQKDISNGKK